MENIQLNADLDTGIESQNNEDNLDIAQNESEHSDNADENYGPEEQVEDSRFKDGEELTLVRVRFPGNAKSFPFIVGKRKFQYGQKVMAMSDRGMTVGYINSFPYKVAFHKTMLPLRSIAREASAEDIRQQFEFHESEKKAEVICLRLIEKYELDMVLTHVEFIQFGKKAVFYFNAPQRVDFRDLVKDLVHDLKMRIELRQISVRDRAAALGSVGACGLQTCCSSFLKNYGNVTIKMAKNQNLALIPSKLNGVCGQIKCCIKYEDEVYNDKRKNLPKEGSIIEALNGDRGRVFRLHLLIEQFEMLTDRGIKRKYASNQFTKESLELPMDYRFPETFENIIDETKTVIGLTVEEELVSKRFKEMMDQQDSQDTSESEDDAQDDFEQDDQDEDQDEFESEASNKNDHPEKLPHYREETKRDLGQNRPTHQQQHNHRANSNDRNGQRNNYKQDAGNQRQNQPPRENNGVGRNENRNEQRNRNHNNQRRYNGNNNQNRPYSNNRNNGNQGSGSSNNGGTPT